MKRAMLYGGRMTGLRCRCFSSAVEQHGASSLVGTSREDRMNCSTTRGPGNKRRVTGN